MPRIALSIVFFPSLSLLGVVSIFTVPGIAGPPLRTETANYANQRHLPHRDQRHDGPQRSVGDRVPPPADVDLGSVDLGSADLESELVSDLADGQLDRTTLLDAALIIGGLSDRSTMRRCQARWKAFRTLVGHNVTTDASSLDAAKQVFRFMHDEILVGEYFEDCNAIDRALLDGDYNCVTATILFCCLARESNVEVRPESLPGHVRCLVLPHNVPIETTDPSWHLHAFSPTANEDGRCLTDVELLAKLFYNRGLAELNRGNFAAALAATELSWQLDGNHEAARDNVATVVNNWALELSGRSNFAEALSLLERGRQLVPDHPILYANESHIRDAWKRKRNVEALGP